MGHMEAVEKALISSRSEDSAPGRSPRKGHTKVQGIISAGDLGMNKEDMKLLLLLHYLQVYIVSYFI